MDEKIITDINTLYTIYCAGFNHGNTESGAFPEHGTFDAFHRLIKDQSPLENGQSYYIKNKLENYEK